MKLLTYLFRNSPYIAFLAVATALVSGLGNASLIALIHNALDRTESLPRLGWQFGALAFFALMTALASQSLLSYLYRKAVLDWQVHLSREILRTPLRRLEEIGRAELLTVLVDDVMMIGGALLPMLPFCTNVVVVVVCLGYLCWLSWKLFLGVLIVMSLGSLTYRVIWQQSQVLMKAAREDAALLYGHFQRMTRGVKELQLHSNRRHHFLSQHLQPTAFSRQRRFFVWGLLHSASQAWSKFLLLFVIGAIIFVFPNFVEVNQSILTGYVLTLLYIRSMLFSVMAALPAFSKADVAFQKLSSLGLKLNGSTHSATIDVGKSLPTDCGNHTIKLVGVSHTYYREQEDDRFTFGPIDLDFNPGEITFLVGGNGSGKTTLAKLITGLYVPESGAVYWNGQLVTDHTRDQYRQIFSAVFTDFQLFDDLLGLQAPQLDEKAQTYLHKLQLNKKVSVTNGKLSTTDLSGGQRQRLALLTAYLENRSFYVFDEWAANQDPIFRNIFYTQLLPELKAQGKTVLVISHDDKYFHYGDRVITLEYGNLFLYQEKEVGSPGLSMLK